MLMSTLKAWTAVALAITLAVVCIAAVWASGDAILSITPAIAHSWYPEKCCGGHDCSKVDSIEKLEDGDLLFHAGSISVVVPAEFMRLPSPDNHTHVCVYEVRSGVYRPRCVFVPGLM
jgi:hypothetical protein